MHLSSVARISKPRNSACEEFGAPGGTRTPGLLVRSQPLYPSESGIARGILELVTIPAKFEGGVFRPLESVAIEEGTLVEVHVPVEAEERPRKGRSIKDLPFFGMWADRDDIADGVSYVDQLR